MVKETKEIVKYVGAVGMFAITFYVALGILVRLLELSGEVWITVAFICATIAFMCTWLFRQKSTAVRTTAIIALLCIIEALFAVLLIVLLFEHPWFLYLPILATVLLHQAALKEKSVIGAIYVTVGIPVQIAATVEVLLLSVDAINYLFPVLCILDEWQFFDLTVCICTLLAYLLTRKHVSVLWLLLVVPHALFMATIFLLFLFPPRYCC
jgi:hypothetical protein